MTLALNPLAIAQGSIRRYDRNGDGRVVAAEVHSGAAARGNVDACIQALMQQAGVATKGVTAEDVAGAMTRKLDANKDGQIDLWESFGFGKVLGLSGVRASSRTVFEGVRQALAVTVPAVAPVMDAAPVVFLNYDETVQAPELASSFTAIGRPLEPRAPRFTVSSSHANGNAGSSLEVGFRLENTGKAPLVLRVGTPAVGHQGGPAPRGSAAFLKAATPIPGGYRVVLAPGKTLDFPAATVSAHAPGGDPRDGSRMVTYKAAVAIEKGDPTQISVRDVARFPEGGAKAPHMLPDAVSKKHHEGVFLPVRQVSPPVVLAPGNEAALNIAGSQRTHDARYDVVHTFFVALPKGQAPKAIVFRGGGGMARPIVNGRRLPTAVGDTPKGNGHGGYQRDAQGDLLIKSRQELTVQPKDFDRYLKPTGSHDPAGNPIYQIDVTFVAGDNGDLGVYAKYGK